MTKNTAISPDAVAAEYQRRAQSLDSMMVRLGGQFNGDNDLAVLGRILNKVIVDGPDQNPSDVMTRATQVLALLENVQETLSTACKSLQTNIAVADTLEQVGKAHHRIQNPPTNV